MGNCKPIQSDILLDLKPEPNLWSSTYYRDKSAQLNTVYGGHPYASSHVGAEGPGCGPLSICFAEDRKLVAAMPKTLPRPSGIATTFRYCHDL
jgi:hypothetical protein